MRLFIALDLPEELKASLQKNIDALKAQGLKARWTSIKNLHITLAFLGECDREEEVKDILSSLPFPKSALYLEQSGLFRDILVLKAKASSSLQEYVKALKERLDQAGIDFDHKAFKPHITLARKFQAENPDLIYDREVSFDQLSLFESVLTPNGPIYTPLLIVKVKEQQK